MKISKVLYLVMAISLITSIKVIHAGEQSPNASCDGKGENQEIFYCASNYRKNADRELNDEYKKLLRRIDNQYKADKIIGRNFITKIKTAQNIWIKLRDADCSIDTQEIEKGTLAYETMINICLANASRSRSDYLRKISPDI